MMRQDLRAALCLATLAAVCGLATAQSVPAPDTAEPPAPAAAQPDTQTAPAPAGQSEPTPSVPDYRPSSLTYQIGALLEDPAVARDHWGIYVTNLDGSMIYGLNQAQLFQPASTAKLFTTAAAMALLGPAHTFRTAVAITSPIKKGVLSGNLYLVGGGDANFGANDIPYLAPANRRNPSPPPPATIADIDDLANQIYAKGIRRIEGNIVGDDTLFSRPYPPDWSWDDLIWAYGAPVSALTIHDSAIQISAAPGATAMVPDLPYYSVRNEVFVSSESKRDCDSLHFSRMTGSKELNIEGSLPKGSQPCTENIAISDPAEYAAMALRAALESRNIRISGSILVTHNLEGYSGVSAVSAGAFPGAYAAPGLRGLGCSIVVEDGPDVVTIAEHYSPPLVADVTFTNKISQNLHAEEMLRNIGRLDCGDSQAYPPIARQFLIKSVGIDPDDFHFVDGSGLSTHDLVTPRATAKLLQFATTQPWFATWKASLPVAGEDGTLGGRFAKPPLKGHVFAKTGTLGEARALSGYLDCASGRTVIFSIMVDNHLPGTTADREVMDKIVAAIQAAE